MLHDVLKSRYIELVLFGTFEQLVGRAQKDSMATYLHGQWAQYKARKVAKKIESYAKQT